MLASDSKLVRIRKFEACLGVVLEVYKPEEFKKCYFDFIDEIKTKYNIRSPRNVFKSYELKRMVGVQNFETIAQEITNVVSDYSKAHIVFASFNTKKIPKVIYYKKRSQKETTRKKDDRIP